MSVPLADRRFRERVVARRDVLLGLWAARRMGLPAERMEAYAAALPAGDGLVGAGGIVERVSADLAACGRPVEAEEIRRRMRELELEAVSQLTAEAGATPRLRRSGTARNQHPVPELIPLSSETSVPCPS